jgi:hypothetical protein
LEKNGKRSSGKHTRALNIRYFTINDHVEKGTISIKYIPTNKMIGDYMSKGLQGIKFHKFKRRLWAMLFKEMKILIKETKIRVCV